MSDILRITGMVTGLDTDDMVKQMLKVEQLKVDRVKQKKQYAEWQKDAYREISNLLRSFKDEYFNYSNMAKNMRSTTPLNSYKVLYGGAETSNYLNLSATKDSSILQNPITKIALATAAKVSGTSLAKPIQSGDLTGFDINLADDNTKVTVTFNGASKVIDLTPMSDGTHDISDVVADLQQKLNTAFGSNKITVGNAGGKLTFSTADTNRLTFGYAYNAGWDTILGHPITEPVDLTEQNNKFKLTVVEDGVSTTKTIALDTGDDLSMDQIIADLQAKLDSAAGFGDGTAGSSKIRVLSQNNRIVMKPVSGAATASGSLTALSVGETVTIEEGLNDSVTVKIGTKERTITVREGGYSKAALLSEVQKQLDGAFGMNKAVVSYDETGHLRFEEADADRTLETSKQEDGGLDALKLSGSDVNRSNKIDLSAKLSDIAKAFQTELIPEDTDGEVTEDVYDLEFTINGVEFGFESTKTSLNDVINAVNTNTQANVNMRYDEMTDTIVVESKNTGDLAKVEIADGSDGNLMAALGLQNKSDTGSDAVVSFAGGTTITRSTNAFNYDGVSFELKQDYVGSMDVSLTIDTTETFDLIKGFVDKYNEIVGTLQEKLTDKRDRDFLPLTEEQKKEMSDKEIELWEEQAKKGMLQNDSILRDLKTEMRSILFQKVDGVQINLFDIGISTTSDYETGGMLVINEEELKNALRDKPQEVAQLFAKEGDTTASKGISNRLFDVIEKNIRTSRDVNGYKGLLLEKAGITGDPSDSTNQISSQIDDYDDQIEILLDKLSEKEDYYYQMFARMESAIAQMNNQSAWLTSQFGGGS